jgi:hypothetical protein
VETPVEIVRVEDCAASNQNTVEICSGVQLLSKNPKSLSM